MLCGSCISAETMAGCLAGEARQLSIPAKRATSSRMQRKSTPRSRCSRCGARGTTSRKCSRRPTTSSTSGFRSACPLAGVLRRRHAAQQCSRSHDNLCEYGGACYLCMASWACRAPAASAWLASGCSAASQGGRGFSTRGLAARGTHLALQAVRPQGLVRSGQLGQVATLPQLQFRSAHRSSHSMVLGNFASPPRRWLPQGAGVLDLLSVRARRQVGVAAVA